MSRVDILSLVISVVSALFAGGAWYATYQAAKIASFLLYRDNNAYISKDFALLGPLTPYGIGQGDEDMVTLRLFFLNRFNRFKFAAGPGEEQEHIRFREAVMGHSVSEFRRLILARGGTQAFADKAAAALLEIKNKEPYFDSSLWDTFFRDYDWTPPKAP